MGMLPQELVDFVIDGLSDDWRALAACAHVHPDWAPRAHSHLRRGIVLTIDWPDCPDLDDFSHVFCPSSSLASDVSILSICGPPQLSDTSDLLLIPETLALDHLPQLRLLTLRSFLVSDVSQLIAALKSCECLEELHIDDVGVELTAMGSITSTKFVASTSTLIASSPAFFARLKTLCIRCCDSKLSAPLLSLLTHLFALASPHAPVQSLSLHFGCPDPWYNPIGDWGESIVNMRETIADISVTVPISLDRFGNHGDNTILPAAIIRCPHLRRLLLRYKPGGAWTRNTPVAFLNGLNKLFTSLSSRAEGAGANRFQELEMLTLILPREVPLDEEPAWREELARMGRVLTRDAYPALERMRVGVECGRDEGAEDMVDQIDSALRPLREGGIETEVVALPEDEGETCSASVMAGASR